MKKILIVSPHSDDAELGVGGYIHREVSCGEAEAYIVVLACGDYTSTVDGNLVTEDTRKKEGYASGEVLGVCSYEFLEVASDGNFNTAPTSMIVGAIENQIQMHQPDELFFPLPSFHDDHTVTHAATIASLRPHPNRFFPSAAYCYEYPGQGWGPQPPEWGRIFAEISDLDLKAKLQSLNQHKSQWAGKEASLFGRKGVEALAKLRGAESHRDYAEMFYLMRGTL